MSYTLKTDFRLNRELLRKLTNENKSPQIRFDSDCRFNNLIPGHVSCGKLYKTKYPSFFQSFTDNNLCYNLLANYPLTGS